MKNQFSTKFILFIWCKIIYMKITADRPSLLRIGFRIRIMQLFIYYIYYLIQHIQYAIQ